MTWSKFAMGLAVCAFVLSTVSGQVRLTTGTWNEPVAFASGGKFKMLYDCRQRPQSVYLNGKVYLVYNGEATPTKNGKGSAFPMLITYDPGRRRFSEPTRLGHDSSSDHHYSPVIWADADDHLHVLFGCHKTPGTHLISKHAVQSESTEIVWENAPQIAPKISYPAVFRIHGDKELIYYRTDGHTSSWTYRISEDNGRTWTGPDNDVTDLDSQGRLDWSSYQTKLPGKDGKSLHVVFTDYDDNKNSPDPQRFFNPRYDQLVSNEWKYNLSYVKIDLESGVVRNADGRILKTPIDIDYAKENCQIWDTQWRGAGVPPSMAFCEDGSPAFLHVLSEESLTDHRYYYVRRVDGQWKKTPITKATHQWNSCYLAHPDGDDLRAFLVVGEGYLEGGYMDRHGGGQIEEWSSSDQGNTWKRTRKLFAEHSEYSRWRFNNIQPVVRPDGSIVEGMLVFYGWADSDLPEARAFLLHENRGRPRK